MVDAVSSDDGELIIVSTSDGAGRAEPGRDRPRRDVRPKVKSLTLRTPTLDDVFTELTGSHIADAVRIGPIVTASHGR